MINKDAKDASDEASIPIILEKMEVIDLPAVTDLEQQSYPKSEAVNHKVLDYMVNYASHLCFVASHQDDQKIVGFIVSTGAPDDTQNMTADMMRNHYQGNVLCIHSVVIGKEYRRKGYGTFMLKSYLDKIREHTQMKKILLLAKRNLVPFYENVGFREVGTSEIVLGNGPWIEMAYTL